MVEMQKQKGDVISLHTHLIVREDLLALYGFLTPEERDLYIMLLGVSGIGPRTALGIISALPYDRIISSIVNNQSEAFSNVPGIGKKTAQKIIIHMQGKVEGSEENFSFSKMDELNSQVLGALINLGYSVIEAQSAIQTIPSDSTLEIEERLRIALNYFNK
jgi:Holliday junction DNA helicase RuvA